jgi:hypothetical protein
MGLIYGKAIEVRPILILRWLVRLGLIPALAFALSSTATLFTTSRECQGAFSAGFSNGFDRYRCAVVIRHVGTNYHIRIPLQ